MGREVCRMLAPQPGIEFRPWALEGQVLAAGPPGKSRSWLSKTETGHLDFWKVSCLEN